MTATLTIQPARPATVRDQLSPRLVAIAVAAGAGGVLTGGVLYLNRSAAPVRHSPGTAAWPVHLCLLAAAIVLLAVARAVNRRRRPGRLLLLAPLGRRAEARLRTAVSRHEFGRLALAALPLTLCVYTCWRVGEQVLAGLDPHFTADAWGGPSYLGAMFCHYLDGGLITAACATALALLLPRPPEGLTGRPVR